MVGNTQFLFFKKWETPKKMVTYSNDDISEIIEYMNFFLKSPNIYLFRVKMDILDFLNSMAYPTKLINFCTQLVDSFSYTSNQFQSLRKRKLLMKLTYFNVGKLKIFLQIIYIFLFFILHPLIK